MKITSLMPESDVLAELGRRLARIRRQRGLSQVELADRAGIGIATLRRLESGHDTQLATWLKVVRALDMTAALDTLLPENYASPMHEVLGPRRHAARRRAAGPPRWGDETA